MIKATSLMDVGCEWPEICFDTAGALIAGYGADAATLEDPSGRIRSFWHSCGLERLERFGRAE